MIKSVSQSQAQSDKYTPDKKKKKNEKEEKKNTANYCEMNKFLFIFDTRKFENNVIIVSLYRINEKERDRERLKMKTINHLLYTEPFLSSQIRHL